MEGDQMILSHVTASLPVRVTNTFTQQPHTHTHTHLVDSQ